MTMTVDTEPVEQDDVPLLFFDRLGMQEGIRNFGRPLFVDQLGMQGREVQDDRSGGRMQDFVPPPFVEHDRPGMQGRKQEGQALGSDRAERLQPETSSLMKRERQALGSDRAEHLQPETSSPLDLLDFSICGAELRQILHTRMMR